MHRPLDLVGRDFLKLPIRCGKPNQGREPVHQIVDDVGVAKNALSYADLVAIVAGGSGTGLFLSLRVPLSSIVKYGFDQLKDVKLSR